MAVIDNGVQVRNAHRLLRAAFFEYYQEQYGHDSDRGPRYEYQLTDQEAVDWVEQLMRGDVQIELFYNEHTGISSPALGAW